MDFSRRFHGEEMMDDPAISGEMLSDVFQDINRANTLLGGNRITLRAVKQLITQYKLRRCRILDIGCGDGTMLLALDKLGRSLGVEMDLVGLDISPTAIKLASDQCAGMDKVSFLVDDVFSPRLLEKSSDIVITTLTLHHISEAETPAFLKRLADIAKTAVVINDLQRSRLAYLLFKCYSSLFVKTAIAASDGLTSIRSGFSRSELEDFAATIPEFRHRIKWKWAFRYVWLIEKKRLQNQ